MQNDRQMDVACSPMTIRLRCAGKRQTWHSPQEQTPHASAQRDAARREQENANLRAKGAARFFSRANAIVSTPALVTFDLHELPLSSIIDDKKSFAYGSTNDVPLTPPIPTIARTVPRLSESLLGDAMTTSSPFVFPSHTADPPQGHFGGHETFVLRGSWLTRLDCRDAVTDGALCFSDLADPRQIAWHASDPPASAPYRFLERGGAAEARFG